MSVKPSGTLGFFYGLSIDPFVVFLPGQPRRTSE
jgi:hypothetical protein